MPTPTDSPLSAPALSTVRGYTSDLIAVVKHVRGAIERQLAGSSLINVPMGEHVMTQAVAVLLAAQQGLESRLEATGGLGLATHLKEAATSVSGFLAGLYGQLRGETTSRAVRDDLTGLNFVFACASMLHTTAHALGDHETCKVVRMLIQELPPILLKAQDLLPHAVVNDLAVEKLPVAPDAAAHAVESVRTAWSSAS